MARVAHRCAWLLFGLGLSAGCPAAGQFWAEAQLSRSDPYVDEVVLYTVRLYSPQAVRMIEIDPPDAPGVSIEQVGEMDTRNQHIRGQSYVVNEFRYALTTLQAGRRPLGAARLKVTPAAASGAPWSSMQPARGPWGAGRSPRGPIDVSTPTLELEVRPPVGNAQPWLPARGVEIRPAWEQLQVNAVGEPVTLTVTVVARGAPGERLPGVGGQLQSADLKVYAERPQFDTKLGRDGRTVWGRRVETFTLVPTRAGRIEIPSLELPWWNLDTDRPAFAAAAGQVLLVGATGALPADDDDARAGWTWNELLRGFALPVGGGLLVAFLLGLWLGAGHEPPRIARRAGSLARGLAGTFPLRALTAPWRHVQPLLARIRTRVGGWMAASLGTVIGLLPLRARLWWCVRCVANQGDPGALCNVLRRFACEHLNMPANAPLRSIAGRLTPADDVEVRDLFQELEDAVYAQREIDLEGWKRRFRRGVGKALRRAPAGAPASATIPSGLPALNP